MRSTLIILLTTLSYQVALAESCPDLVSTANSSFNLQEYIAQYGDQALSKARERLENRRKQGCDTASNYLECHTAIELAAKAVDTLASCNSTQPPNHILADSLTSQTSQKKTKHKPAQETSNNSATIAKQQNIEEHTENPKLNEHKDIETNGCPYLTKYAPGAFHKLNTHVCIRGGTKSS